MQSVKAPPRHATRSALSLSRLAAVALLLVTPSLAMAVQQATEFDIKAYDFQVLTTGHFSRPAESIEADEEYYLQCMFGVAGSTTTTSTQIRVLVNGQLIHSASVSIHYDQHWITTRAAWTPPNGGIYTAKCEVNPNMDPVEATYINNQMTEQVAVTAPYMDPAKIIASRTLKPEALNRPSKIALKPAQGLAAISDIRVHGLEVRPVDKNGIPKSTAVERGRAGRTYYLHCEVDPVGLMPISGVRFLFRVNGQIVKDIQVPMGSGDLEVGAEWSPQTVGNYQLSCEANPQKTFQEASFANNKGYAVFPVQAGGN